MEDLFVYKNIRPMLIGSSGQAFDSPDHIFELKLDGERCLAYLDGNGTDLRNKRNMKMIMKVPELSDLHLRVRTRCILDGELIIVRDGKPDFFEIQRRSLTSDPFKIGLASKRYPATFTAFDILYHKDRQVTDLSLMERKRLLAETVMENERLAISRYIENDGIAFYKLAEENGLEGIVAKKKESRYLPGVRTKEWIKIKNLIDEDFVVCGYIEKEPGIVSLVLGQYGSRGSENKSLIYKGHVTLGISTSDFHIVKSVRRLDDPPFEHVPPGNRNAIWIEPVLVCTVKYMMKTPGGSMRQPVFKGLRDDKEPEDCISE